MKSIFSSLTTHGAFWGALCFALGLVGIHLDRQETQGVFEGLTQAWPMLLGIVSCAAAFWHRLQAVRFDKSIFLSRTFYTGLVTAFLAVLTAFHIPTAEAQDLFTRVFNFLDHVGPTIGSVLIIIGRLRATKALEIRRATPA